MSDDPGDRESHKNPRVNIHDLHELRHWAKALEVSPVDLRMAVAEVGSSVATLKKYFQKRRAF